MRTSVPAAVWCLALFVFWELVAALLIVFYITCPCCWPFPQDQERCQVDDPLALTLCTHPPCVRKCCPEGQELFRASWESPSNCNFAHSNSTEFNLSDIPLFLDNETAKTSPKEKYELFSTIDYGLCPHDMYALDPSEAPEDDYGLLPDGRLLLTRGSEIVPHKGYCIDTSRSRKVTMAYRCFGNPSPAEMTEVEKTMFSMTLTISVPFLLITLYVYLLLPELQNLHGKSLICHVFSLCIAYVFLVIVQNNVSDMNSIHHDLCVTSAFIIQFSFLATFFWLNIMCFDIWWVFSGLRPLRGSVKEREHKKFIFYSLYAWGGPLIILLITVVMELVPSIPDTFVKPQFGVDRCWFKGSDALVLYFYLPIGVLVLLNIVMFMTTALQLRAHTRETKVLQNSESRRTDEAERQRLSLYLKLFIVMGINWVMELVSFIFGGPKYIWYVTDLGNTLQGVLIFLIFVWKRRILRLLNQKLCPRLELVAATSTSNRSKTEKPETAKTNVK